MTRLQVCRQLGKTIRELRARKDWSQETLAEEARLHRTYLGGIERGLRNPSLYNLAKIAKALGVPLRDLFPDPEK